MRTSSKKTTVAVLRSIIGIKDLEMAELLKCSPATIHSLELGRLRLSEAMAIKIFHETGISYEWLVEGNPKKRPRDATGRPYTKASFEFAQATKVRRDCVSDFSFVTDFLGLAIRLRSFLAEANRRKGFCIAYYKVERFLSAVAKEYAEQESRTAVTDRGLSLIKDDISIYEQFESIMRKSVGESAEIITVNDSLRPI